MSRLKRYQPNTLERVLLGLLGLWNILVGAYAASPFYLDTSRANGAPTLRAVLDNTTAIHIYGVFLFIDGIALVYVSFKSHESRWYHGTISNALLFGFLLRLYSTIGTTTLQSSWRPPSYLAPITLNLIFGVLYLWVRINDKSSQ